MQNYRISQKLIFLHIPKTAGVTLHQIINRQYKPSAVFTIDGLRVGESIRELERLSKQEKERLEVVKGHCRFGIHSALPTPAVYITLLRHPIDRVISHYCYIRQKRHHLFREVIDLQMRLEDFVCSRLSATLHNAQTRLLSGDSVDSLSTCQPDAVEILQRAKQNLRGHFAVVGLTEQFDATLILLKRTFGWKTPFYTRANVTQNRPPTSSFPRNTLALIERYNALDIELYDDAKARFAEQIHEQKHFGSTLKAFQCLNTLYRISRRIR